MASKLFVTGFGPFGKVTENPSGTLAAQSGCDHRLLEVSFAAVDYFLAEFVPKSYRGLLMIGVAAGSNNLRMERFGRNIIGPHPDVRGVNPGPMVDPNGPEKLSSTIWKRGDRVDNRIKYSQSAGDYLCNYSLYRALQHLAPLPVGFLHIPEFNVVADRDQVAMLAKLIERINQRI